MRCRIFLLPLLVLVGFAGCQGGAMLPQITPRQVIDLNAVEHQAGQVLDYIEGHADTPPFWADEADDKAPFWEGFVERAAFIADMKGRGCLAENNRGRLELRKCDDFSEAEERNTAQRIMAQENKDRKTLYREVAHMNRDHNLSVTRVEQIYVMQRLARARSGEIFQLPKESDQMTLLKKTETGARLGAECQASAWVSIP